MSLSGSVSSVSQASPSKGLLPSGAEEYRTANSSFTEKRRRFRTSRAVRSDVIKSPRTPHSGRRPRSGELPSDPISLDMPEGSNAAEETKPEREPSSQALKSASLVKRPRLYNQMRESRDNVERPKTYRTNLLEGGGFGDDNAMDELQQDQLPVKRRRPAQTGKKDSTLGGASVADGALISAKENIGDGLRVAEATTYDSGYRDDQDGTHCFLQVVDRSDCLIPVNEQGSRIESLGWMKIDLQSCISIGRGKSDCAIIEVLRREDNSGDRKLVVSFTTVQSAWRFAQWASHQWLRAGGIKIKDK